MFDGYDMVVLLFKITLERNDLLIMGEAPAEMLVDDANLQIGQTVEIRDFICKDIFVRIDFLDVVPGECQSFKTSLRPIAFECHSVVWCNGYYL